LFELNKLKHSTMAHPRAPALLITPLLHRIQIGRCALAMHTAAQSRAYEEKLHRLLPDAALMHAAGVSVARLCRAIAPHARCVWLLCGPGNNGNDGLIAGQHLQASGLQVFITCFEPKTQQRTPRRAALLQAALDAGAQTTLQAPGQLAEDDLLVDALLGIGSSRPLDEGGARWVAAFNRCVGIKVSIDIPSGIDPDTGRLLSQDGPCVRADHTLQLLTAKPGLWMNMGRDAAGQIWLDALTAPHQIASTNALPAPRAILNRWPDMAKSMHAKQHHGHKGSHGEVLVVGGETLAPDNSAMAGAACLAALTALHAGAGRVTTVFIGTDDGRAATALLSLSPALMLGSMESADFESGCVVAGCGGGKSMAMHLGQILARSTKLVLDADALNHIALDRDLQSLLEKRHTQGQSTVLTPHPLEAARLLGIGTNEVQAKRLQTAEHIANTWKVTVILKGSGSVIASPGEQTRINPSGNGSLASAGTGDVLAGLVGAWLSRGLPPHLAARSAAWQHGCCGEWLSQVRPGYSALELAQNIGMRPPPEPRCPI
jgi:ADP-dependent NAD(P)H-hydrate dehydratase / NAD(P)H-hydrate epimerase